MTNDVAMLRLALAGGTDPKAITSPYQGTALIAAAHLGHAEVVRVLIAAGAPLDHVNNLGWTALMESIVLGNGGKAHTDTLEALVQGRREPEHRGPPGRDPARPREKPPLRRNGADPRGRGGALNTFHAVSPSGNPMRRQRSLPRPGSSRPTRPA